MLTEKEISFKIEKLYQSKLFSALELLQILKMLAGFKHSVRLIFENDQKTSKRIKLFDLLEIPCERVISTGFAGIQDRNKGGWSNLCSSSKQVSTFGLYLSLCKQDAKSAAMAEKSGNDSSFGESLSYPACCNKFFSNNFSEAAKLQGDLFPFVHKNTADPFCPFPYLLNPLWYFDAGYIEYWPCSFRCEQALTEARIGETLLKKYLPKVASEMDQKLKSPVLYTEYSGIFCFIDGDYNQETKVLRYDSQKILATSKTKLFQALQAGDQLRYQAGKWCIYQGTILKRKITNAFASFSYFANAEYNGENTMFEIIKKYQALGLSLPGTTDVEIVMLMTGKKKALRLIVYPNEREKVLKLAEILGMEYYVSDKRVAVVATPGTGDEYIDYISDAPEDAKYLICLAKHKEDAMSCAKLEAMPSDQSKILLNNLLNYPVCCVESFLTRTPHDDWIKPFLKRTPIANWYPVWTNRLGYLFTGTMPLYDYEPCSAFCESSLALGQQIKKTFQENNILFTLERIIAEAAVPIFLHDGLLVRIPNAKIKKSEKLTEILYNPSDFQLTDYKLKSGVEDSLFWESNRMIVSGREIILYHDDAKLKVINQTQYNNRIFLFEE